MGRTHVKDRRQCQFGTRRVRPKTGPPTRDVLLLALDRDHASASRLLGQRLRLVGCVDCVVGVNADETIGL